MFISINNFDQDILREEKNHWLQNYWEFGSDYPSVKTKSGQMST